MSFWPWLGVALIALISVLVRREPTAVPAIPATEFGKIAAAKGKTIVVSGKVAKENVLTEVHTFSISPIPISKSSV